jgi:hypothetical protein
MWMAMLYSVETMSGQNFRDVVQVGRHTGQRLKNLSRREPKAELFYNPSDHRPIVQSLYLQSWRHAMLIRDECDIRPKI